MSKSWQFMPFSRQSDIPVGDTRRVRCEQGAPVPVGKRCLRCVAVNCFRVTAQAKSLRLGAVDIGNFPSDLVVCRAKRESVGTESWEQTVRSRTR